MNYSLIEKGVMINTPQILPTNWRNISNLPKLSDVDLKILGWIPVEYQIDTFDTATQKRLPDTYTIKKDKVIVIFNYLDKTLEEIAEDEAAAAKPPVIDDTESVQYIRTFLKTKFGNDALFPTELK